MFSGQKRAGNVRRGRLSGAEMIAECPEGVCPGKICGDSGEMCRGSLVNTETDRQLLSF